MTGERPNSPATQTFAPRDQLLHDLAQLIPTLRREFGVKELALFGSVARGESTPESDIDLLVTFEGKATFDGFMELKLYLEDTLGRTIDLGTPDTLRPEIRPLVERDLIRVA